MLKFGNEHIMGSPLVFDLVYIVLDISLGAVRLVMFLILGAFLKVYSVVALCIFRSDCGLHV